MPFTYTGNPSTVPLDAVRLLIGDTEPSDPLLQDGEINYALQNYNNAPINAAIWCCEFVVAKLSRLADESVGQVKVAFSQKAKTYGTTLQMLRARLARTNATPYAGGISIADKQVNRADTDTVKPDFTKHMMENHQTSNFIPQAENDDDNVDIP